MRNGISKWTSFAALALLFCLTRPIYAADDPQLAALQQTIGKQFTLTKATADNSDIVTPGSVVVLHKDGLQMCGIAAKIPLTNIYKNGSLSAAKFAWAMALGLAQPGVSSSSIPMRKFVGGEKFWITAIAVKKSGVVLQVLSDTYADVRYYGQIEFPFDKKSALTDDGVLKAIMEVMTAEPVDAGVEPQPPPVPEAATPVVPLPPIAPPPPPADLPPVSPKTIALGETKDQVVATLGQPQKVAMLGTKEIDYYPDMKVVLVNGKVTDIQ
jgi:hypothetical protein